MVVEAIARGLSSSNFGNLLYFGVGYTYGRPYIYVNSVSVNHGWGLGELCAPFIDLHNTVWSAKLCYRDAI